QPAADDDPLGLRQDFPVLEKWTYLNSPYIAPSPQSVVDATVAFHQAKASDPIGLGSMLDETRTLRQRFAQLVNAVPGEIGLLSTTSEGENVVTAALDFRRGDNVVIDDLHYDTTVFLYNRLVETRGIEVRVVESANGAAPIDAFARLIDDRTRVVSVSWVSHQNGYRHDLAALADLAHVHDAYLYVDAIQGVGALQLDVRQTGVDFFTVGGYKWLLAGFGVAPFYVRSDLLDDIDMDRVGWRQLESEPEPGEYRFYEDARKYGYATPAFGAIYQMRAALDYVLDVGVERIEPHVVPLANHLNNGLRALGFDVLTPAGNVSPIVAFRHGVEPSAAADAFDKARVRISTREQGTQIRAGIALFNNRADVDRLLEVADSLQA
ncbi:MAG: aminotransferase class V-fold PLP-dependent enzyme, partial [Gammaproteobacteria bacterium]|nr:aminotransferase class V-fold PLP-dependent enzyme [Gammaproteobacteria bacterium]